MMLSMKVNHQLRLALIAFILVIVIKLTPNCSEGRALIKAIEDWSYLLSPPKD
jgi:hypothetical protein